MDFTEKTTKKETIYEGKIVDVSVHEVTLPDGRSSKREVINHSGAVAVVAVTPEQKIVMVKQYRKPLEKPLVEIPAGKLEGTDSPEETAARELKEETGYTAGRLQKIASFYTSPGFADEIVHLYEAFELQAGEPETEEDEFIELMEISLKEADELIQREEIHDAKTMYAVQYVKTILDQQ